MTVVSFAAYEFLRDPDKRKLGTSAAAGVQTSGISQFREGL
jgi:hypothetical protein